MDEAVRAQLDRDLCWVLTTPPLLPAAELSWSPKTAFSRDLLERIPEATIQALERARHGKLGHYFEGLVMALFTASPNFRILANNSVIQSATRTLGELDLLLEDYRDGRIVHLELALKFYLLLAPENNIPDDCRWIGPGRADFLTLKYERMITHQLRLPELAAQEGAWPAHLPRPDISLGWVTGRAFIPPELRPLNLPIIAKGALIRPWITTSQAASLDLAGRWINKSQWLSSHSGPVEIPAHRPPAQWLGQLEDENEDRHWFIVPDEWPALARESMLSRFAPGKSRSDQGT